VRLAVLQIAADRNDHRALQMLEKPLDRFSRADHDDGEHTISGSTSHSTSSHAPAVAVSPPINLLAPLTPDEGLHTGFVRRTRRYADAFESVARGERPMGRLYRDDELSTVVFGWHRMRSVNSANEALEWERGELGDDFDERNVIGRTVKWSVLSEMAAIVSLWLPGSPQQEAISVVASGTRSAYWLWLEDDDRAMAALRCVLEQTARARVHRLKSEKALKLEQQQKTTPRDWLEAAGWKRLTPLNTVLGEFAHTKDQSKWRAAHRLLAEFQTDVDDDAAIYTARGFALDFVASLAASEVASVIDGVSPAIGAAARAALDRLGLDVDIMSVDVDAQFNHIWSLRTRQLIDTDFVKPTRQV
jgi:hypothetical protein